MFQRTKTFIARAAAKSICSDCHNRCRQHKIRKFTIRKSIVPDRSYDTLPLHASKAAAVKHTAGDFCNIAPQRECTCHARQSGKGIVTVKVCHSVGNRQITRKAGAILECLPSNAGNVRGDHQTAGQTFASPERIRGNGGHTIEPILVKSSRFARWTVDKGRFVFAVKNAIFYGVIGVCFIHFISADFCIHKNFRTEILEICMEFRNGGQCAAPLERALTKTDHTACHFKTCQRCVLIKSKTSDMGHTITKDNLCDSVFLVIPWNFFATTIPIIFHSTGTRNCECVVGQCPSEVAAFSPF
ncbi:hypothetical protein AAA086_13395 [Dysosmobacter welbionis]